MSERFYTGSVFQISVHHERDSARGLVCCCVISDVILPTELDRFCYSFSGWAMTNRLLAVSGAQVGWQSRGEPIGAVIVLYHCM